MSEAVLQLERLLHRRAAAGAWDSRADPNRERFFAAFSSASRKLGKKRLVLDQAEHAALRAAGVTWSLDPWGADELGRVVALARIAPHLTGDELEELLRECYARGDNRERSAVLRALPFLPDAPRFVPLAVEACRTSVDTIFVAICCDNPFPSRYFPESNFCQMVIKALFTGTPVARIVGLNDRISSELLRMAGDYASERRAAGRTIPDDLGLLLDMARANAPTTPRGDP